MIIIIGSVTISEASLSEAMLLSQQHVDRSRNEPGCLSHDFHIDAENPNRLVFVEKWLDMGAVELHFQLPSSAKFVAALTSLATDNPIMDLYESEEVQRH